MNKLTREMALAAAKDAANRNMAKNGRTSWNEEDWNIAAELAGRLMGYTTEEAK